MAWASIGAAVIGGMMAQDAAGSASGAQKAASKEAIGEQRRQYDLNRADQAQWLGTGTAGNKRLAYLLGLSTDNGSGGGLSYDQLRQQLTPQFTKQEQYQAQQQKQNWAGSGWEPGEQYETVTKTRDVLDQAALDAEINRRMQAQNAASLANAQGDSNYGSLLKKFSASDLQNDPVYQSGLQFGLDQGTGALNARATQTGSYDSGATLKALTRYANDYGTTKANESYNRYNADQTNIYNRLAGISGTGQTAANNVATLGANTANNISNLMTGAGNASAAGIVGGANAWGNALQSGVNSYNNYQNNQTLKQLLAQNNGYQPTYGSWNNGNYQVD